MSELGHEWRERAERMNKASEGVIILKCDRLLEETDLNRMYSDTLKIKRLEWLIMAYAPLIYLLLPLSEFLRMCRSLGFISECV